MLLNWELKKARIFAHVFFPFVQMSLTQILSRNQECNGLLVIDFKGFFLLRNTGFTKSFQTQYKKAIQSR